MNNKIATFLLLTVTIVTLASCASSRKYGCPTAAQVKKASNKS